MPKTLIARGITLLICAESKPDEDRAPGIWLVCGRPPGHEGKHRDIEWAVEW